MHISRQHHRHHRSMSQRPAATGDRFGRRRPSSATCRRRRVTATIVAAVVAMIVFGAVNTLWVAAEPAGASTDRSMLAGRSTQIAQPGDTLWEIAAEHHGEVSIQRYVDLLVALNGGASIDAGQVVILP